MPSSFFDFLCKLCYTINISNKILTQSPCELSQGRKEDYMTNKNFSSYLTTVPTICTKCQGKHRDFKNNFQQQQNVRQEFGDIIPNECVASASGGDRCPFAS